MAIFAVIRDAGETNNSTFGARIAKRFPDENYKVTEGQWLVSTDMDIKELCQELDVRKEGRYSGTLVLKVAQYYGLHNKKLWSWLRERRPQEE